MSPDLRVLSYGGGTQSAALALMSADGQLPKLDAVVFADTHGELPETYAYAEYVEGVLARAGIPFHRVSAGDLEATLLATERVGANPTPPAHVLNPDGTKGKVTGYRCSYECGHNRTRPSYKDTGQPRGHVPACTDCDCQAFDPWRINVFPLIKDFGLSYRRVDTIRWFSDNGHPTPPRSACWFCPNSRNARWRELQAKHPDLWERACKLDDHIRDGGAFTGGGGATFRGAMFLHDSRIPLRDADLRTDAERLIDSGQDELFDAAVLASDCDSGVCFT